MSLKKANLFSTPTWPAVVFVFFSLCACTGKSSWESEAVSEATLWDNEKKGIGRLAVAAVTTATLNLDGEYYTNGNVQFPENNDAQVLVTTLPRIPADEIDEIQESVRQFLADRAFAVKESASAVDFIRIEGWDVHLIQSDSTDLEKGSGDENMTAFEFRISRIGSVRVLDLDLDAIRDLPLDFHDQTYKRSSAILQQSVNEHL